MKNAISEILLFTFTNSFLIAMVILQAEAGGDIEVLDCPIHAELFLPETSVLMIQT